MKGPAGTGMKARIIEWIRNWAESAKTALEAHVLAGIAVVVFVGAELSGVKEQIIEALGVQPGKPYTLCTHAIMHTTWWHLAENLLVLELAGPFIEKWIGKGLYILAILFITIAGAHLAITYALESWSTGNNPVGMSISTRSLLVVALYLITQKLISAKSKRITQLARNTKREAPS